MPAKTSVRPATEEDLPALTRLWRELVGFDEALGGQDFRLAAGTPEKWERHLKSHVGRSRRRAFVALSGPEMAGFLLASLERPSGIFMEREYGHVSAVYVQAAYRGKGFGSALVDAAFRWFDEKRVSRVRVATDAKNVLGTEFWRHRGFVPTVVTMDRLL